MNQKKLDWTKNINMTSWWFSWDDLRYPADEVIDRWERRADIYRKAGVNTVTTFGVHLRWDWLNYWDKYDYMLKNVADICHARNIKVVDHHSNQLTHFARSHADRVRIANLQDHHLPLFPDSGKNQIINGKKTSDWRMVSAEDNKPIFIETYCAEAFCPNNPDYREEYYAYVKHLVENIGIDALMSDDTAFHPDMYSCVCPHCRKKFFGYTGQTLPDIDDTAFWNNYSSPLFQKWIQMRYDSISDFYKGVKEALPQETALWACSCSDSHPYKVRQGCSMEKWSEYMDVIFAEMYHGWDLTDDIGEIITELAVLSSIAGYRDKSALIIAYSNKLGNFHKWAALCGDYGVRPWFCRQVRSVPVVYEEDILKSGFPQVKTNAAKPYGCGIVYSRKLKDKYGEKNLSYYSKFKEAVIKSYNSGCRPQIIFDELQPDNYPYDIIYVPMYEELSDDLKNSLSLTGCKLLKEYDNA